MVAAVSASFVSAVGVSAEAFASVVEERLGEEGAGDLASGDEEAAEEEDEDASEAEEDEEESEGEEAAVDDDEEEVEEEEEEEEEDWVSDISLTLKRGIGGGVGESQAPSWKALEEQGSGSPRGGGPVGRPPTSATCPLTDLLKSRMGESCPIMPARMVSWGHGCKHSTGSISEKLFLSLLYLVERSIAEILNSETIILMN